MKVDLCVLGKTEERRKKRLNNFFNFLSSYLGITPVIIYSRNLIFQQHAGNFMVNKCF